MSLCGRSICTNVLSAISYRGATSYGFTVSANKRIVRHEITSLERLKLALDDIEHQFTVAPGAWYLIEKVPREVWKLWATIRTFPSAILRLGQHYLCKAGPPRCHYYRQYDYCPSSRCLPYCPTRLLSIVNKDSARRPKTLFREEPHGTAMRIACHR